MAPFYQIAEDKGPAASRVRVQEGVIGLTPGTWHTWGTGTAWHLAQIGRPMLRDERWGWGRQCWFVTFLIARQVATSSLTYLFPLFDEPDAHLAGFARPRGWAGVPGDELLYLALGLAAAVGL